MTPDLSLRQPDPGLERIGYPASALDDPNQIRLSALESDVAHRVRIRAICENVQIDTELISELRAAGVEPLNRHRHPPRAPRRARLR